MRQKTNEFRVSTPGPGAIDITDVVRSWVRCVGIDEGLLTLHVMHTSASLMIQENADPQVLRDMEAFLRRLVPPGDRMFRHTAEGEDDMPAHVRAALTSTSLSIPVTGGAPALGTWQGIYLYEHRDRPHVRCVAAHWGNSLGLASISSRPVRVGGRRRLRGRPVVLSTGRGPATESRTYELLQSGAHPVGLKATAEDHWARVVAPGDRRPMDGNDAAFAHLCATLAERDRLYE